jgi:hypothetical protein
MHKSPRVMMREVLFYERLFAIRFHSCSHSTASIMRVVAMAEKIKLLSEAFAKIGGLCKGLLQQTRKRIISVFRKE